MSSAGAGPRWAQVLGQQAQRVELLLEVCGGLARIVVQHFLVRREVIRLATNQVLGGTPLAFFHPAWPGWFLCSPHEGSHDWSLYW